MYNLTNPLVLANRQSESHISLISILERTLLNWYKQAFLRKQMSNDVLFRRVRDLELSELNFSSQLRSKMQRKRRGPIMSNPKL